MKKHFEYLRPLKLGAKSKTFFVFDTETGEQDESGRIEYKLSARPEHLIFGVVYGYVNGKEFKKVLYSPEEFKKEFLKKRYRRKMVFAHNAEYDLSAVYGNIYHMDPDAIFNGKFICATNGNCLFADSHNILPTSVKKLGEMLGTPKKELGSNLISHINTLDNDIDYCERDCKIVYDSLAKIFEQIEPSVTIGSLSMKLFRKNYLKKTVKVERNLADQFFNAYYGGRTEAFKIGPCNGRVFDINSAYPWAMRSGVFLNPATLRYSRDVWRDMYNAPNGMIHATVKVSSRELFPVLPVRHDGMLVFPSGTFTGHWMLSEFIYALAKNDIIVKEIHSLIIGEQIDSPFENFVKDLYHKRETTTFQAESYYYKLFLNNLYGKLVQRMQDSYKFFDSEKQAIEFFTDSEHQCVELIKVNQGYFCRYQKEKLFPHTIVPWGAEITAQVRIKLHDMIQTIGRDILYCDTDSVFFNERFLNWSSELVIDSKELGAWKLEEKHIVEIRTLKDYVYYTTDKDELQQMLKGVKKDAIPFDQFGNVFKYKRMVKTRESMLRKDNLPPGTFIEQTKFVSGDYNKRQVMPDGTTIPFIF